jgi:hypothetical protein
MIKKKILVILLAILVFYPGLTQAKDDSLALTVTPPLEKINMDPGMAITAKIKVVNNNSWPVTVYAKVLDFKDKGGGDIEFIDKDKIPANDSSQGVYLSQWITLSQDKVEIDAFRPAEFYFNIEVPENAQPGGHYAAILIGTNPPDETGGGTEIKVSSYISSLLLVRISGAIEEKGMIREFTFSNRFYSGGEGNFRVRFENLGNVHLQPTGDIKVYDMFGKQKGDIPVNVSKDFGNVLPKSIRAWDNLKWSGEGFFLINRYKAELSLAYGDGAKQTDYQTFFFWGVNWKWLGIISGSLLALLILIILFIRFYIRQSVRSLEKQLRAAGLKKKKVVKKTIKQPEEEMPEAAKKPEEGKIIDLRKKK